MRYKKFLLGVIASVLCLGLLNGCSDYSHDFNISVYTSDDNLVFYSLPEQHSQPDVEVILEKMADVKRQQKTQKDYKEWKKQNQNNETNSWQ